MALEFIISFYSFFILSAILCRLFECLVSWNGYLCMWLKMHSFSLLSFLLQRLVFGLETISTTDLYLTSLVTTYTAYFGTLCGSTLLQAQLLRLGISHSRAFWTTIVLGSLVNYIVLTSLNAVAKNTGKGERKESAHEQNIKMAMVPLWTARASRSDFLSNVHSTDSIISGRISNQLNERSHGEDQKWTIYN